MKRESNSRWIENPESMGLRLVGLAHEVSPAGHAYMRNAVEHTGWYLDPHGMGETVSGVVYQVTGKDGRARYVAGYADPWNCDSKGNGPAYLCLELIQGDKRDSDWECDDGLREAARYADSMAETMAEQEREYQSAWGAGQAYAEALDMEKELRTQTLEMLKQNRESGGSRDLPAIHDTIRRAACDAWERICESRRQRVNLANGDSETWFFWNGDTRLRDAFCEGAELQSFPNA